MAYCPLCWIIVLPNGTLSNGILSSQCIFVRFIIIINPSTARVVGAVFHHEITVCLLGYCFKPYILVFCALAGVLSLPLGLCPLGYSLRWDYYQA